MMHTVPKELRGATLGVAHQWVRTKTDSREYVLKNPSGERVSLAELTNGSVVEVDIIGAMKNPAHPAEFTARDYGMGRKVNLTHILPEEVTPTLVSSMVTSQGLFGAIQSLSMLLSRPISDTVPVSAAAQDILNARRVGVSGSVLALRNPAPKAPYGFGRSYGGRILGQEIAEKDKEMQEYVSAAVKALDNADFSISEGEIENFTKNVLIPYLLAAHANQRAIEYIRKYVLPAKDMMSKERQRALDREFKYMVEHMATSPKDFFHGKEYAIIAHPGFNYPAFGPTVLPVPSRKSDTRIIRNLEDFFEDAGNPPRYQGGDIVIRSGNRNSRFQFLFEDTGRVTEVLNWQNLMKKVRRMDFKGLDNLLFGKPQTSFEHATMEAYIEATQKMGGVAKAKWLNGTYDVPACVAMSLPGMRPTPVNWPVPLILALMEVLFNNRTKEFSYDTKKAYAMTLSRKEVSVEHGGEKYVVDPRMEADDMIQSITEQVKSHGLATEGEDGEAQASVVVPHVMNKALKQVDIEASIEGVKVNNIDLSSLVTDAVSLALTKHGYEASEEDIKLATVIVIQSFRDANEGSILVVDYEEALLDVLKEDLEVRREINDEFEEKQMEIGKKRRARSVTEAVKPETPLDHVNTQVEALVKEIFEDAKNFHVNFTSPGLLSGEINSTAALLLDDIINQDEVSNLNLILSQKEKQFIAESRGDEYNEMKAMVEAVSALSQLFSDNYGAIKASMDTYLVIPWAAALARAFNEVDAKVAMGVRIPETTMNKYENYLTLLRTTAGLTKADIKNAFRDDSITGITNSSLVFGDDTLDWDAAHESIMTKVFGQIKMSEHQLPTLPLSVTRPLRDDVVRARAAEVLEAVKNGQAGLGLQQDLAGDNKFNKPAWRQLNALRAKDAPEWISASPKVLAIKESISDILAGTTPRTFPREPDTEAPRIPTIMESDSDEEGTEEPVTEGTEEPVTEAPRIPTIMEPYDPASIERKF
jgi:hypothetical protein